MYPWKTQSPASISFEGFLVLVNRVYKFYSPILKFDRAFPVSAYGAKQGSENKATAVFCSVTEKHSFLYSWPQWLYNMILCIFSLNQFLFVFEAFTETYRNWRQQFFSRQWQHLVLPFFNTCWMSSSCLFRIFLLHERF